MSDPLLDFLLSRDREKVIAEARPVSLEKLYAEASIEDRELIDEMPVGVLRRKLIEAETRAKPEVKVIGNDDLIRAGKYWKARAERAEASLAECRDLVATMRPGKVTA